LSSHSLGFVKHENSGICSTSPSRATLWPDDFRDEVLARLLELNRQRAEEERLSAAAEAGRVKVRKKSTAGRKAARKNPDQPEFFES